MIVVVFRSRLRPEFLDEFERDAQEMLVLAQSMPGFISYKRFRAEDGLRITSRVPVHLLASEEVEEVERWEDFMFPRGRVVRGMNS